MPAMLYEADTDPNFELTPDYNALLVEWEVAHPEHSDPRFTAEECKPFIFVWPGTLAIETNLDRRRARARSANGQFAKALPVVSTKAIDAKKG